MVEWIWVINIHWQIISLQFAGNRINASSILLETHLLFYPDRNQNRGLRKNLSEISKRGIDIENKPYFRIPECPSGEIGRRTVFRSQRSQERAGSNPVLGTLFKEACLKI